MVAIPDYSPSPREVKTESQGKYTEVAGLPAISYEIAFDQGTHLTAKEVHQEPRTDGVACQSAGRLFILSWLSYAVQDPLSREWLDPQWAGPSCINHQENFLQTWSQVNQI